MKTKFFIISIISIFLFLSCAKVPLTGRRQVNFFNDKELNTMSLTQYSKFLGSNKVVSSGQQYAMVKRVGSRITTKINSYLMKNGYSKMAKSLDWKFNLVQKNEVNAWCMPGGKIVVYTGILPLTKTEDGLATVMAHEIAHAIAKHSNERMSQQLGIQLGGMAMSVALQQKSQTTQNIFMTAVGVGGSLGSLAFSRKHELEADEMGVYFMAMAGYDPREAIKFWTRMSEKSKSNMPNFLRTHPIDVKRITALKKIMPKAMKYYSK